MSLRLPRAAAALLLASTVLLAGCSGDGDAKDQSSSSPAVDGELTELDADSFLRTVMAAQERAGTFKGVSSTSTGTASSEMDLEGEYTDTGLATRSTTPAGAAVQMAVIVIDKVAYLQGSVFNLPDDKWLKFDSSAPENADSPLTQILGNSDPSRLIRAMRDPKELTLVGPESVDGVSANHYRMSIDSASYAERLSLPRDVASRLPPELTFDMWVDAENRPVQVRQEYEAQGQSIQVEQTYTDYGSDVTVEAPPAADVVTR